MRNIKIAEQNPILAKILVGLVSSSSFASENLYSRAKFNDAIINFFYYNFLFNLLALSALILCLIAAQPYR